MMRGASRWDEPRAPVVASAPAARTATVAAPSNGVRMVGLLRSGDAHLYAAPRRPDVKLPARRPFLRATPNKRGARRGAAAPRFTYRGTTRAPRPRPAARAGTRSARAAASTAWAGPRRAPRAPG